MSAFVRLPRIRTIGVSGVVMALAACGAEPELKPFASDGCSLFPDRSMISDADWCACCYEHDIAYWQGGTKADRKAADVALRECVAERTKDEEFATLMYNGVRAGGSPYFYNWYRWGYGWPYGRGYEPLSEAEQETAEKLLKEHIESDEPTACAVEASTSAELSDQDAAPQN